jgi:hypothetical protein
VSVESFLSIGGTGANLLGGNDGRSTVFGGWRWCWGSGWRRSGRRRRSGGRTSATCLETQLAVECLTDRTVYIIDCRAFLVDWLRRREYDDIIQLLCGVDIVEEGDR